MRMLVGCGDRQARELAVEPLATLLGLRERAVRAVAPRFRDACRLFRQVDPLGKLGEGTRRLGDRRLARRQSLARRALFRGRVLACRQRLFECALEARAFAGECRLLRGERTQLLGDLRDLLRDPRFVLAGKRQLLLESRHLGIGGVERPLPVVQRVARRVVVGAHPLELRFDCAHFRLQALQRHGELRDLAPATLARAHGVLLLRVPEHLLRELVTGFELAELGGNPRLVLEPLELAAELVADVLDAGQVLARVGDPPLGLLAALLVLGYAGGLLEEDAQLLGLGLDHARDHALLDDRVRAGTEARAEEEVVDVAAPDRDVVDVVARVAVAREHALDRDLGVLAPLPADAPGAVVEVQLDRGAADRLAVTGTVEDHVLHRLAAQRRGLRFAEHPAHGVDHVGLAAAVRADDADELSGRADGGGIDEGLEAGELDLGEAQGTDPIGEAPGDPAQDGGTRRALAYVEPAPDKRGL